MNLQSARRQVFLRKSFLITALIIALGLSWVCIFFFTHNTSPTEKKENIIEINKSPEPAPNNQKTLKDTESPEPAHEQNEKREEEPRFSEEHPLKEDSDSDKILKDLPERERKIKPDPGIPIPERKEPRQLPDRHHSR